MSARSTIGLAGAVLAAVAAIALLLAGAGFAPTRASGSDASDPMKSPFGVMVGPCAQPDARERLLCPDLRMRRPFDLWFSTTAGKLVLHAANDIESRGLGPLEIRGKRITRAKMLAHQVIYRRGGGKIHRDPTGHLHFHPVPYQGSYWKYESAAHFEMWKLSSKGEMLRRVSLGPKADYCFRDLERTKPSGRSPRRAVYPGCSQSSAIRGVTLGTSVGWSDIYPSDYDDNLINVTGLRGCFKFRQVADPLNEISEMNEKNNVGSMRIRLTGRPGPIRSC